MLRSLDSRWKIAVPRLGLGHNRHSLPYSRIFRRHRRRFRNPRLSSFRMSCFPGRPSGIRNSRVYDLVIPLTPCSCSSGYPPLHRFPPSPLSPERDLADFTFVLCARFNERNKSLGWRSEGARGRENATFLPRRIEPSPMPCRKSPVKFSDEIFATIFSLSLVGFFQRTSFAS